MCASVSVRLRVSVSVIRREDEFEDELWASVWVTGLGFRVSDWFRGVCVRVVVELHILHYRGKEVRDQAGRGGTETGGDGQERTESAIEPLECKANHEGPNLQST